MAHLSQLLALPHLGLKLLQSGAGDPEISWVSITELLDLSRYLEGGEVIMTTGLQLDGEAPRWNDFVASLSRARVAAIGFGIGVNHASVPAPLLRAASTYRVALFEIPLPTPFIAVSKAAAELLRADELRATRSALQVQLRLLDGTRGEQQPAEVLASIAQATGRQLALVTGTNTIIASTQGFDTESLDHAAPAGAPAAAVTDLSTGTATTASGTATTPAGLEYVPLNAEGTLKLAITGSEPLTPEGSSVIAAGAMALGFGVRNDHTADRIERERWEFATERVLNGTLPPQAIEVLSPGLTLPATVRAVAVQGAPEDVSNWRHEPRHGTELLITATEEIPGGLARAWQLIDGTDPEPALARSTKHGLDLVIGRAVEPGAAPLSVRSARARLQDLPGIAALYVEPRVPRTVWADRDAPFLEAVLSLGAGGAGGADALPQAGGAVVIAAHVLGPLSETAAAGESALGHTGAASEHTSDRAPDRALLRDTLMALFEADGQRGPAAAALGIHRNTLRDRIIRIERLTGRSVGSAADRAELWFALRTEALAT